MTSPNPHRPLLTVNADFTQGPPFVPGASAMSLNAASRRTAVRKIDTSRGRQYELDQVQAGTATITITDPLEMLHPANTASPFNMNGNTITSYRATQIGAWWNPTTSSLAGNFTNAQNLLPGALTTGASYTYDPSCETWFTGQTLSSAATFATSTDHLDGTHTVWKAILPATADFVGYYPRVQAGVSYFITVDVWAATGTTVRLAWNGATASSMTIVGNSAFQTVTFGFSPTAADTAAYLAFDVPVTSHPATFYVSNFLLQGQIPGWSTTGSPVMVYTTAIPHAGAYSVAIAASAGTDTVALPLATAPGVQYTFSAWVLAQGTGTVGKQTIGTTSVSTTAIASYQRLILTFVATDAVTYVTWTTTGTSYPAVIYIDDYQLELGASASTAVTTGPKFYPIYTGYIERYPIQWDMSGTRGIRPLTAVDALSILSRTEINQSYATTVLGDSPYVYIPMDDASIPQAVQLPQGGQPMLGYQSIGTSGSVNFGGDTFLDDSSAVTVVQQNATPPVVFSTSYVTYLGTFNGSVSMNPQAFTLECWIKFSSGTVFFGAGAVAPGENLNVEAAGPTSFIGWGTHAGYLFITYNDPNGNTVLNYILPGGPKLQYPDGQWHYVTISCAGSNQTLVAFDGRFSSDPFLAAASQSVVINNFFFDATTYFGDPLSSISVSNVAAYPHALAMSQMRSHYNRGTGYLNEVSGARVARLLSQYWGGSASVAAGKRLMAPDYDYNTRFMLDVLQEIQETERGLIYADASGTVVFEDSTSRYVNNLSSKCTFGENPTGSSPVEYPYVALAEAFDPTYTFSQTNLTRPDNSDFPPLPSPLPTNPPYGQRVLSQEVQVNTDFDLYQASTFYLARYGSPTLRVETLTLDPAANPALWPVVLALEISQRITVKRRTGAGLTTTADYYIEQINHSIDAEAGTWTVSLQCSPVYNATAWILGDSTYGVLGSTTVPIF